MILGGLQKTTLIDFPGRVACTVFTVGCNFRCPFCHNKDLISLNRFKQAHLQLFEEEKLFEFLSGRKKILDGVCITGGEPTLQPDLPEFCRKLKALDLEVKLDTNGSRPEVIKQLISARLVDFIAMDVKTTFENYSKVVQCKIKNAKLKIAIKNSIKLILKSGLEYEFRTTVVPGIHDEITLIQLAKQLAALNFQSASRRTKFLDLQYVLQAFRPQNCLDVKFLTVKPFTSAEMKDLLQAVRTILPKTKLRGAD